MPTLKAKRSLKKTPPAAPAVEQWYYEQKPEPALPTTVPTMEASAPSPAPLDSPATLTSSSPRSSWRCFLMAAAIFLFPFITYPWTLSPQEFPKQLALLIFVVIGLTILLTDAFKKGVLELIPRHPFLLLGAGALLSVTIGALRSGLPYQGIFGYGTETLAGLTMLLLGLWILLVFHGGKANLRLPYQALLLSGSLLSLLSLLTLLGINPYRFINIPGFNPAGTTTSAAVIAAVTMTLTLARLLQSPGRRGTILTSLTALAPLLFLLGTGLQTAWIVLATGSALILVLAMLLRQSIRPHFLALLIVITLGALLFTFLTPPALLRVPLEVGPAHQETWSITKQVLRDRPALGSGPATFAADYLRYRSLPILQTPFWNIAFDWGSSAALTFLATLGWVGGGLVLLTVLTIFISYLRALLKQSDPERIGIFAAGLALFVAAWLVPLPLALRFFLDTLLGLMLAAAVPPLRLQSPRSLPSLGSLGMLIILVLLFVGGRRALAEHFAFQGQRAAPRNLEEAQRYLTRAARIDPWNDQYLRGLSEISRLLLKQNPTAESTINNPQQNLQVIREQADGALREARRAIELAPGQAQHFITLGNIYMDIAPITSGAAQAAVEAFKQAQALSPVDPALLVNLGIAQQLALQTSAKDGGGSAPTESTEKLLRQATEIRPTFPLAHLELARLLAQGEKVDQALTAYRNVEALAPQDAALRYEVGLFLMQKGRGADALRELEIAVSLAPNFSNARWFLAQLLEEKGEIPGAIAQIEKVVELNPENTQAKTRLEELKKKIK